MNISRSIIEAAQDSELSSEDRIYEAVRDNIFNGKYYAEENSEGCYKKVLLMSGNLEALRDREEGTHQADNQSEILKLLGVNPKDYYDKDKGISSAVYIKIREYRNGVYEHEKLTISAKIITDKKSINEYQTTLNFKDRAYSYEVKSTVASLRAAFKVLKYTIVKKTTSKPKSPVDKPKLKELSDLRIADAIGYLISHGVRSFPNIIYYYNKYGLKNIIESDPYFSKTDHLSEFGKLPSSDYVALSYYVDEDTDDGYKVNVSAGVSKRNRFEWSNIKLTLDIKPSDNPSSVSEAIIDAIDKVVYDEYKDEIADIYQ